MRQGVLDAALISGLELNGARDADTSGLRLLELGSQPLQLAVAHRVGSGKIRQLPPIKSVLVPHRGQWAHGLRTLPLAPELRSRLWLLLPRTDRLAAVLTRTLEHLS